MSEQQAFLDAIAEAPDDDARRLVYADWLEEREGQQECKSCIDGNSIVTYPRKCYVCKGVGRIPNGFRQLACDQRLAVKFRRVIERPDDDGPRLEYAMVCEEYGRADRAEFIRLQCELATLRGHQHPNRRLGPGGQQMFSCHKCDREIEIEWREAKLYRSISHEEMGIPHGVVSLLGPDDTLMPSDNDPFVNLCRGFVSRFTGTLDDWMRFGPSIATANPIEYVMVIDFAPLSDDREAVWYSQIDFDHAADPDDHSNLPEEVFAELKGPRKGRSIKSYRNTDDANEALSHALIARARGSVKSLHATPQSGE